MKQNSRLKNRMFDQAFSARKTVDGLRKSFCGVKHEIPFIENKNIWRATESLRSIFDF